MLRDFLKAFLRHQTMRESLRTFNLLFGDSCKLSKRMKTPFTRCKEDYVIDNFGLFFFMRQKVFIRRLYDTEEK